MGDYMKKETLQELKSELRQLSNEEKKKRDLYLRGIASGEIQGPLVGYPSIDKPWLPNYSKDALGLSCSEKSIYQFVYDNVASKQNETALDIRSSMNNFERGIKISYGKFLKLVNKLAKASHSIGMKPNEIVPIILPNIAEARELIYSNSIIGATSYPISPLLPVNQLENILLENSVKTLFIFKDFYQKYKSAINNSDVEHIIYLDGTESLPLALRLKKKIEDLIRTDKTSVDSLLENDTRAISWDEFCAHSTEVKENLTPYYDKNHVAVIIGTSGTTGTPKGVCLTDDNINSVAHAYINGDYFKGNFMDALLPSIGYGISMIHYQTASGRYVYLIPELLTTKFPEAVEKLHPDNFPGGPVHYINLENSTVFKNGNMPKIENFISGGATLPKNTEKKLNNVDEGYEEDGIDENIIVRQGFGLSENAAVGSYCKRGSYKFGSIGIPIIYENIGIFNPDTDEELGYNELGEICITGPAVMKEYLNNIEETKKVIKVHADGKRWIHTKDIGYMDESGHLFHLDRIKNIFMRTGFNVHPSKIAEFLNNIPFVQNSAVIGFEHPKEQCVPVAFVQIDQNNTNGKTNEELKELLISTAQDNLEEPSVPVDFIFVDELPINAGGKIDIPKIKKSADIDFNREDKVLKKSLSFKK